MLPISSSELVLPSTGSWFPSSLSSTWRWAERIERIFSDLKSAKKRDILSDKGESGMALQSVSLRPKAVMLTPTGGQSIIAKEVLLSQSLWCLVKSETGWVPFSTALPRAAKALNQPTCGGCTTLCTGRWSCCKKGIVCTAWCRCWERCYCRSNPPSRLPSD